MTKALGRELLFGMTTSLELQGISLPKHCDLDTNALHTTASCQNLRVQSKLVEHHVWKMLKPACQVQISKHVFTLDLISTWAQLGAHVPLMDLIVLAESIIHAQAHNDVAQMNHIHHQFVSFVTSAPRFTGKQRCKQALRFIMPGVCSPRETESRLALLSHGLPCPEVNFIVPGLKFTSGAPMTLDMAWPQWHVGVEYDGDQHRYDKQQWHRDREKRDKLRANGWRIVIISSGDIDDDEVRARFALQAGRQLASRGALFNFSIIAKPLERIKTTKPVAITSRS
ncbi:hypothetical protein OZX57_02075 [Bifidobacterium sp. ESL0682]|uniref:hypothetical protein n=1 Tax=Bifidobacterium sp. ESL0682 TaxID=2983212 RepID=UPI0023F6DAA2|nr:hypothetical protein [Bifidobacterium sp. ESL0682]WEV42290.1 hypothetical protein OZX57_02075 [Bifidobacterium sp. ESL0682]